MGDESAEVAVQGVAKEEKDDTFKVEGFNERGGVLRVEEETKAKAITAPSSYQPWFQQEKWFLGQGKSEHLAGGSNRDELLRVLRDRNYTEHPHLRKLQQEIREMIKSDSLSLRSLYDKESDFERLKCRAEFHYVSGEYAEAAREFLHLLGSYKIAPPRRGGGGLKFELLDALVRCYRNMGALVGPDAQVLVDDMKAAVGGQQLAVMHMLHSHFLRAADRMDESLEALQYVVAKHPAEPALWVEIAEGYRGSSLPQERAALCARRCMRFAVKMVQYAANARQCSLSLAHHAAVLVSVRRLCAAHPDFYLADARPEDPAQHLQELPLADADRALLAQNLASDFERKWLAGGGEEAATSMLSKAPDASIAEMSG